MSLTQAIIRELLDYNRETGELTWKRRGVHWFKSKRDCSAWNTRYAGKHFGTMSGGRLIGAVFGKLYLAHRVAWFWVKGEWPKNQIDHKNRNPSVNKWKNLRDVTAGINRRNQRRRKICASNSGVTGVHTTKHGTYRAVLMGKDLGKFKTIDEAVKARKRAMRLAGGFTEHHGT